MGIFDYNSNSSNGNFTLDDVMNEHGISYSNSGGDYNESSITDLVSNYWGSINEATMAMSQNIIYYVQKGDMQAVQEEEERFFTRVKNRIVEVWNRVVDFFSRVVNKVRGSVFGKLKPHIEEIKRAIDNNKMDYSKAAGKQADFTNFEKVNDFAAAYIKLCTSVRDKIKSLVSGEEHKFYANKDDDTVGDLRNVGYAEGKKLQDDTDNLARVYFNEQIRIHFKDFIGFKKTDNDAGAYENKTKMNMSGAIGITINAKDPIDWGNGDVSKIKDSFRSSVDALNKVDKAMAMMNKGLEGLRNEVNKMVNYMHTMIGKGTYKDQDTKGAKSTTKREKDGDTAVHYKRFNMHDLSTFAHLLLGHAEKMVKLMTSALYKNITIMKSCITKEKTNDKIEESYDDMSFFVPSLF